MDRSVLLSKNPWWMGKQNIEKDEDYRKWNEKKFKWNPEIVDEIPISCFSLNFIFGPRQVGKTTSVKLLIKKLLDEKKIIPEQIFYFRCDELKDYKELADVLKEYLDFREEKGIKNSYIFLDEITFADEWFRTIKENIDSGVFKNDVLTITGSVSFEVSKHAEYFPGRRGNGKDFVVLPLSFREFIKVFDGNLYEKLSKFQSLESNEIKKIVKNNSLFKEEVGKLFNVYLKIGGFPLALESYYEKKEISTSTKETYLNWIKSDLVKTSKDLNISREIMKAIISKIPSAMSWEGLAKDTSIKSPKTISSYVNTFQDLFLLNIAFFIDPNDLSLDFAKNKKIHFIDPLFYDMLEEWCLINIKDFENKKVENILASHLVRFGNTNQNYPKQVFYWQGKNEVDCVARDRQNAYGFEVKWTDKVEPIHLVIGKMKDVFVLSKTSLILDKKNVPLSLFLSGI
jgi:uncharacterized protein